MLKNLTVICLLVLLPQAEQDVNFSCVERDSIKIERDTVFHPNTTAISEYYPCDNEAITVDSCLMNQLDKSTLNIYDFPYSKSLSCPNKRRLTQNTIALFGGGLTALGVLELLPENATAWNKTKLRETPFFERWWMHVKKGAVWDHDNWVFNFVLHPYGGAAYYMSARSQGYNSWQSALYSFGISTLFWEYGIEAFMEYPSIQDLIITPFIGSLIGEQFYKIKRSIVANGYHFLGSQFLGHLVAFFVDPVNEFMDTVFRNTRKGNGKFTPVNMSSMLTPSAFSLGVTF
ncbi:MAG: DUF3943 domain-containing protein [Muribaculaceae bacterium]|nr:DUF3943 domain-containing protein [Muribaculaceae bacterium]